MTDYYGEDGMKQAFDNMKRSYQEKRAFDMASAADHVSVWNIPEETPSSNDVTQPESSNGFVDMHQPQQEQEEQEQQYEEQLPQSYRAGERVETYSNDTAATTPAAGIHFANEDKRGIVYETENDRYDRFNPETGEFTDTNGSENADLIETSFHSSVTGETITKRPNKDVFTWRF